MKPSIFTYSLVLSIVGDVFQCLGVIIVGLTMGFYYDWKLTLIALAFLPFIVAAQVITQKSRRGGRDIDKKIENDRLQKNKFR